MCACGIDFFMPAMKSSMRHGGSESSDKLSTLRRRQKRNASMRNGSGNSANGAATCGAKMISAMSKQNFVAKRCGLKGYLLHGPPGDGKGTAVRAMLTTAGLAAYTLRLFDSRTEDADMECVFERAVTHSMQALQVD